MATSKAATARAAWASVALCLLAVAAPAADSGVPAAAGAHWAFQPVRPQTPPAVRDAAWPRNDVDRFILATLEEEGLTPSTPADRRTLIRRVTFDLTGLPPAPAEVAAFVEDASPDAYEKLVDRLLASPHYGERWGRHWLDLARYADTNGADENYAYPNAWRYRDYVVRSLNADKPYDRFVTEQLAGDLLPAGDGDDEQRQQDNLVATGFLLLGPKMLAEQDKPKLVMDVVDEQIDAVGQTFLGLTLGCARCHDHKFDPIPTDDYYALAGVFRSTRSMADLGHVSMWNEREVPSARHRADVERQAAELSAAKAEIDALAAAADADAKRLEELRVKFAELEKAKPPAPPTAMAVADEPQPQDVPVHVRGSHLAVAPQPTPRGVGVRLLDPCLPRPAVDGARSGRLELARWITDPANPLAARVMVNRLWQGHFGVGLVSTPSNFGLRGSPPSHPQLLDWLAAEFLRRGWSLKQMHRLILLSATYQMSSAAAANPRAAGVDPENRLLWRQNRRRLEAEPIRDALLAAGGNLDLAVGGALEMPVREKYTAIEGDDPAFRSNRRAIYLPVVRGRMYEMFTTFDYADAGVHTPVRPVTVVPQQALFLLNSELVAAQAALLAKRVIDAAADDPGRVTRVYELLYARPPTGEESSRATAYLAAFLQPPDAGADADARRLAAWTSLCRVLLASDEFVYVN